MFKLMVVSGPNRGTSYAIHDGENAIGRQAGNVVVLPSAKVSKRHCVLVVDNSDVTVADQGSSNGTFVNGLLAGKPKRIKPGDRISVGEYVLELVAPVANPSRQAPAIAAGMGNVLAFPNQGRPMGNVPAMPTAGPGGLTADQIGAPVVATNAVPRDLVGRALWAFETYVMPFFYGLNLKSEWKMLFAGIMGVFVVLNVIISVSPLLDANHQSIVQEVKRRARHMAVQLAESNVVALSQRAEGKTDIGMVENAENVRVAVIVDLDNRIIAPAGKANQYLGAGLEAREAYRAAKMFRAGRESGYALAADDATVVAIEPVKVVSNVAGKNVPIAMAVVSIDSSIATLAIGEMSTIYAKSLVLSGLLALLTGFILYRLTLKPFFVLNDDMDRALKGELGQVTHEFKFEELDPLWDLINSALQRIPKGGGTMGGAGGGGVATAEDFLGPLRTLADAGSLAFLLLDAERKVVFMNSLFEEMSGIRADASVGKLVGDVARDQALSALVNDLCDRAQVGGDGQREDFDFSGISYKVSGAALGKLGDQAQAYVLMATKNG